MMLRYEPLPVYIQINSHVYSRASVPTPVNSVSAVCGDYILNQIQTVFFGKMFQSLIRNNVVILKELIFQIMKLRSKLECMRSHPKREAPGCGKVSTLPVQDTWVKELSSKSHKAHQEVAGDSGCV
jgi:hypothetical protein